MAWIESHQSLATHRKTKAFARLLHINIPQAICHLHLVWWWCLDNAPDGDLTNIDCEDLADAASWHKDASKFYTSLVESGFVDHEMNTLHDWWDYAGKLVKQRAITKEQRRSAAKVKWHASNDDRTRSQRLTEARKKATHTLEEWEGMKTFFNFSCVKCGVKDNIVKDHIVPIYQGGTDGINNIQPLCGHCNSSKKPDNIDYRVTFTHKNACKMPAQWEQNACNSTQPTVPNHNNPLNPPKGGDNVEIPDWIKPETWSAFKEMRQKIRAPLTDSAAKLLLNKLARFRAADDDPNLVLEQSIMNSYRGVFPLKGGGNGTNRNTAGHSRSLPTSYTDPDNV